MSEAGSGEPTIEWMVGDVAERCRRALRLLEAGAEGEADLTSAAELLRSAADDLVSLVGLVADRGATTPNAHSGGLDGAFDLTFLAARPHAVDDAPDG